MQVHDVPIYVDTVGDNRKLPEDVALTTSQSAC